MPRPVVLFFNSFWGQDPASDPPPECAQLAELTSDRSRFAEAAAVVFHLPEFPDFRGFVKPPGQLWVAWSQESDVFYPQQRFPPYMARFDLTMTYKLDSDLPVLYLDPAVMESLRRHPRPKTEASPAVLFTTNAGERSGRTAYLEELMRHMPVDSYGKALRNRELPEDLGRQTKLDVIARYRFTLAFENSIAHDYVTEKFYDPLIAGSVPVYRGAPNIDAFAPADRCYIDAGQFGGPRDLASYLLRLAANPAEFERYLAWKREPFRPAFETLAASQRTDARLRLCRLVVERLAGASGLPVP